MRGTVVASENGASTIRSGGCDLAAASELSWAPQCASASDRRMCSCSKQGRTSPRPRRSTGSMQRSLKSSHRAGRSGRRVLQRVSLRRLDVPRVGGGPARLQPGAPDRAPVQGHRGVCGADPGLIGAPFWAGPIAVAPRQVAGRSPGCILGGAAPQRRTSDPGQAYRDRRVAMAPDTSGCEGKLRSLRIRKGDTMRQSFTPPGIRRAIGVAPSGILALSLAACSTPSAPTTSAPKVSDVILGPRLQRRTRGCSTCSSRRSRRTIRPSRSR